MSSAWLVAIAAFLALQTSCTPQPAGSDAQAQAEAYNRTLQESSRQIERQRTMIDKGEEIIKRQAADLDKAEEILKRQEALVTLQEQQAQRFNAILEKWEGYADPSWFEIALIVVSPPNKSLQRPT